MTAVVKVNLTEKLAAITDYWSPRIAGEMFLVLRGSFRIELQGAPAIELAEGELAIVPRGVEHRPVAETEAAVIVFEPAGTVNTGAERNAFTVEEPQTI